MKQCLVDVNVVLALLADGHDHHQLAVGWFDSMTAGETVLCRIVQLSLIRLLGNRTVMGDKVRSASSAWRLIEEFLRDERVNFVGEPPQIDSVFPVMLRYSIPTNKLVADAWLAAFAIASSSRLVTLDAGFRQFKGLDLLLLQGDPP
jgi:toxin-antitoxin system PIN domain toxin